MGEKTVFFRAKNLIVNTWRSGPDICSLICEPHQCPLHQSSLLTQEPIHQFFAKIFCELVILKNSVFLSRPFWIFFFKKKKLLHPKEIVERSHGEPIKFLFLPKMGLLGSQAGNEKNCWLWIMWGVFSYFHGQKIFFLNFFFTL